MRTIEDLDWAALRERLDENGFAINQAGMGPFFYRMAPPDRF